MLAPRIDVAAFRRGEPGHVVALEADASAGAAHPPLLVARLRDAVCVPGGIVLGNNRVLAEGIAGAGAEATHPHMLRDRAGDWHIHQRGAATAEVASRIGEPVLWLDDAGPVPGGSAPFLELASRLWAADYARAFLAINELRTLTAWPASPSAPKLIEAGGVRARDVFFFDRPIVCSELIVATRAQHLPFYTTPVASQLWQRVADRLTVRDGPEAPGRFLFVAPAGAGQASRIDRRLRAALAAHGFETLDPDVLEIAALARAVADAVLIVGMGGELACLPLARRLRGVMAIGATEAERMLLADRPEVELEAVEGTPDLDAFVNRLATE